MARAAKRALSLALDSPTQQIAKRVLLRRTSEEIAKQGANRHETARAVLDAPSPALQTKSRTKTLGGKDAGAKQKRRTGIRVHRFDLQTLGVAALSCPND